MLQAMQHAFATRVSWTRCSCIWEEGRKCGIQCLLRKKLSENTKQKKKVNLFHLVQVQTRRWQQSRQESWFPLWHLEREGAKKKKKNNDENKKKQTIPVIGVSDLLDTYSKMIVDSGRYTCKSMRNKKKETKSKRTLMKETFKDASSVTVWTTPLWDLGCWSTSLWQSNERGSAASLSNPVLTKLGKWDCLEGASRSEPPMGGAAVTAGAMLPKNPALLLLLLEGAANEFAPPRSNKESNPPDDLGAETGAAGAAEGVPKKSSNPPPPDWAAGAFAGAGAEDAPNKSGVDP